MRPVAVMDRTCSVERQQPAEYFSSVWRYRASPKISTRIVPPTRIAPKAKPHAACIAVKVAVVLVGLVRDVCVTAEIKPWNGLCKVWKLSSCLNGWLVSWSQNKQPCKPSSLFKGLQLLKKKKKNSHNPSCALPGCDLQVRVRRRPLDPDLGGACGARW